MEGKKKRRKFRWIWWAIGIFAIIGIIASPDNEGSEKEDRPFSKTMELTAEVKAEAQVKSMLKYNVEEAEFSSALETISKYDSTSNTVTVNGWVIASNAFGVKSKKAYKAIYQVIGNDVMLKDIDFKD